MPSLGNLVSWFKIHRRMDFQEVDIEAARIPPDLQPDPPPTSSQNCCNRDIKCGFRIFPCTRHLACFATLRWFMIFASICIMAQGSAQFYYNRTALLWMDEYGFSKDMADWLIVGNALFNGIFTVFIIHASIKNHRMVWISALITLFAVTCFALLIPEIVHPLELENAKTIKQHFEDNQLCVPLANITKNVEMKTEPTCWLGLLMMMMFQAALGSSSACLYVHATVYIDDHETIENAIMFNGIFLAFKQFGPSIGALLTWLSVLTQGTNIFGTPEWVGLTAILFIFGAFLGMYPKFLSENIRLKNIVCSADSLNNRKDLKAFISRILRNKVVLLNILCSLLFWSGMSNFSLLENKFNQSKFAYPDEGIFANPMDFQVVIAVLKPMIAFMAILLTASLISTYNIRAFSLALWNGIAPAILVLIFLAYIYLGCDAPELAEEHSTIVENYCSGNCNCERTLYEPVCVPELHQTFFSPCYAGCTDVSFDEGFMTYVNCKCVTPLHNSFTAFSGICNMSSCYPSWLSHDLVQMLVTAFAGTVVVSHTIVSLYCVHYTERCYALAVQITAMGLIGFGPIRSVYGTLAHAACRYFSPTGSCRVYDPVPLGRYILTFTIILLLLSSCCGILMAMVIRLQTSYSRDFLGAPVRRRRHQSACFLAQSRVNLSTLQVNEDDTMEPPATTSLVFTQIPFLKKPKTMTTIPEVTEEIERMEEENIEKEKELFLMVPLLEEEEEDYDETTLLIKDTSL